MANTNWSSAEGDARGVTAQNTVAGYFADSDDAHRAINELADEGFAFNEIGAAFHAPAQPGPISPSERAVNDLPIRSPGVSGSSDAGPLSDSSAVSPLGPKNWGSGPFFTSPSEPPPIPGAEIPSNLLREIPSELASDFDRRPSSQAGSTHDYAYSGSAFESSFSGMGIPQGQARCLSRELRRGGAIVTVKAGSRREAAEEILMRNHGVIRYESEPTSIEEARDTGGANERVQVFGEIHRVYPGYIPSEDVRERKAS